MLGQYAYPFRASVICLRIRAVLRMIGIPVVPSKKMEWRE